jgi:hypothetical protein
MKRESLFTLMAAMLLLTTTMSGQNVCKVLMPGISDSYTGSCKQGLADGKGEASGIDKYTGEFKKGLPDGYGTYIWKTGETYTGDWKMGMRDGKGEYFSKLTGSDSVQAGIWKRDKYVGPKEVAVAYMIGYRNNIGRITCMKMGDERNYIKYKFSRSGESSSFVAISDLMLQGSSGTENISSNFTGFENVTFPFEGKVQFNAPSALNTGSLACELRITINEPGPWLITIYY